MEVLHKSKKGLVANPVTITDLTGQQLYGAINLLLQANQSLPETISKWVAKNQKSLKAMFDKRQNEFEALKKEYWTPGKFGYTYKQKDVEFTEPNVNGDTGYDNPKKDGSLLSVVNNKPIAFKQGDPTYSPIFLDPTKEAEFQEKYDAVLAKEFDVNLFKIHPEAFSASKVGLPSSDNQGRAVDLSLFYDYLVVDEDEVEN